MTPTPQSNIPPTSPPVAAPASPALGADALVAIIGATLQLLLRSQVGTRKEDLTWQMSAIARSLRQGERELAQHEQTSLAGYAGTAAGQIETAARYLHEHDFNTILTDFDRLAHERPAVVMGAMLGLGVVIGRFIKHAGPAPTTSVTTGQ